MIPATLAVIAKAPVTGVVKTRLSPPLSLVQAAQLAEAALRDTLTAALATPASRKVLVLDGRAGPWLPRGIEVIEQRGEGLDERLAWAFADLTGPTLVIGMDTPQVSDALLERTLRLLDSHDAVLGPALDGGYWAIGMRRENPAALLGVPMSSEHTLAAQRKRLHALGLQVAEVEVLRDVDTFPDALAVAAQAPASQLARRLDELSLRAVAA